MNCTICNLPIVLVPSAAERAKKFGGKPADYTALFTSHPDCFIAKRNADTSELIERLYPKHHDTQTLSRTVA